MQRSDFDFDVIGGPSSPPLPPRPTERRPIEQRPMEQHLAAPAAPAEASLDPAAHRPESPAS